MGADVIENIYDLAKYKFQSPCGDYMSADGYDARRRNYCRKFQSPCGDYMGADIGRVGIFVTAHAGFQSPCGDYMGADTRVLSIST